MVLRGSIYSNVLSMETGLTVITPNDYGQTDGKYRVCYVLHGLCGGNSDYSNYTTLPLLASDKDTIYICPEVQRSFYIDMKHGPAYFTYVSVELPKQAGKFFNISSDRADTGVLGGSMGGFGALRCALTRPESYSFCAALAPACLFLRQGLEDCRRESKVPFNDFYDIFGENLDLPENCDLPEMAREAASRGLLPKIYLRCGRDDSFFPDVTRFAAYLRSFADNFVFDACDGGHTMDFFAEGTKAALEIWNAK